MRAGKLDRRITIRRATYTVNGYGEEVPEWCNIDSVWARQLPSRGSERFAAQEIAATKMVTFNIRYRSDLTERDRIVFDGKEYNITSIREIGRRVGLEFDAVADG